MITLLAVDGGLATCGIVLVRVYYNDTPRCERAWAFENPKMGADVNDERRRRTRELVRAFDNIVMEYNPDIIASEAMSFPRHRAAFVAISLAWGVVEAVSVLRDVPLIAEGPKELRKAICASGTEKAAHRAALRGIADFPRQARHIPRRMQVHAYDALSVACWALATKTVKNMLQERG
jgi:Holliday junction resolvasome RuvABC endonuclease subunit